MRTLLSMLAVPFLMNAVETSPAAPRAAAPHVLMIPAPFVAPTSAFRAGKRFAMPTIREEGGLALFTVSVWISGPQTRTTGQQGTWTAMPSGGTTPYGYSWGGDVSGSGASVTATFYDEAPHPINVTVTDANSQQGYAEFTLYVCQDVC